MEHEITMEPTLSQHGELRVLAADDVGALRDFRARNEDHLRPWEPARDDTWLMITAQQEQVARAREALLAGTMLPLVLADDRGQLIGTITLSTIVRGPWCSCNLGYAVDVAHVGRGIGTFLVAAAVDIAFDQLGLHRVQAAVQPHNVASVRLVERLGFRDEGVALRYLWLDGAWRDHRVFALTVEDDHLPRELVTKPTFRT